MVIESPKQPKIIFVGECKSNPTCLILAAQTFQLIKECCDAFMAYVVDTNITTLKLEYIPIVREFPDVFLDDLLGLPPHREVDFTIETVPGVAPISIAPYRMAVVELQELKK